VEEVAVFEVRADAGGPPIAPHVHPGHVESFYVLDGELELTVGDELVRAGPGAWVQIPPGVPHGRAEGSSAPMHVLNVNTPSCGTGAYLRALADTGDQWLAAERSGFDVEPAAAA
jgi:quercetin dioxygenase-like cupin family protein